VTAVSKITAIPSTIRFARVASAVASETFALTYLI